MRAVSRRAAPVAAAILAVAAASGCVYHTESTDPPADATGTTPVVVQVPVPSPPPAPTPAPTAAPTIPPPTAPPATTPSQPSGGNQPLPPGVIPPEHTVTVYCSVWVAPDNMHCPKNPNPQFWPALTEAVQRLQRSNPQIFNGFQVVDAIAYYNGVFRNLNDLGYCAIMDSNEVAITNRGNNNYRENYHILSSVGNARYGAQAHVSACSR